MAGTEGSRQSVTSSILRQQVQLEKSQRQLARQISAQDTFMDSTEEGNQYIAAVIAKKMRKQAKTLEERSGKHLMKTESKGESADVSTEDSAAEFEESNPELKTKTLLLLRSRIKDDDSAEDILKKVLEVYSDYSLADDAMAFLEKTTDDELLEKVQQAREQFNESFGREIRAGKNIATEAREFSQKGLGSPTALRDMYRDITGNPRTPNKLFQELSQKMTFAKMETTIKFILHSLGTDLKAKGPSIPRGELFRLLTEARNMQAILGVYRFFQGRMGIINRQFDKYHLFMPSKINFELLAQLFMQIVEDRYPSSVKIIKLAKALEIDDELLAQIILFSQYRDAVRQVAPKLYRSLQHRNDILSAYIEALEELEDLLEEEDEEYEDD